MSDKMYFGDKPKRREQERSFDEVNRALKSQGLEVCRSLLPGGQQRAQEYVCGNLNGGRGNSLSVNVRTGVWKDFADGVGGKDFVSLFAAVKGLEQFKAKRAAEVWLGWAVPEKDEMDGKVGRVVKGKREGASDEDPKWYLDYLTADTTKKWEYYEADGTWLTTVYRIVHPKTGKKTIRPFSQITQRWEGPEGDRPLLYLQEISQNPHATVVLVEGEKCADAINEVEGGFLGTTVMGGAQAIAKTDFSTLEWRKVVIWRDNDKAGKEWHEKILEALKEVNPRWVKSVITPKGKPHKWDCADEPDAKKRVQLIVEAIQGKPLISGRRPLRIDDWDVGPAFPGSEPPELEWLVRGVFPLSTHVIFAAAGDTGKGMMLLDLALKVAGGQPSWDGPVAFGATVTTFGNAVIFSAEDSHDEIHRRIHSLDPDFQMRSAAKGRLKIIPLPNAGGVRPLIRSAYRGVEMTEEFEKIRDQLLSIDNLAFVAFDPLSTFVQADLNGDSAAAAYTAAQFANLAQETGATVLAAHHMKKIGKGGYDYDNAIREAIRGQTAIVDGARAAYAMVHATKKDAQGYLKKLHLPYKGEDWKNKVVYGEVVKCNAAADRSRKIYVRQDNGLLIDRTTDLIRHKIAEGNDADELLIKCIAEAASRGFPFTISGTGNGLHENRHNLPPSLRISRDALRAQAQRLLEAGRLKKCVAKGSSAQKWLDIPQGEFDTGDGVREIGSLGKAWWKEIGIEEEEPDDD